MGRGEGNCSSSTEAGKRLLRKGLDCLLGPGMSLCGQVCPVGASVGCDKDRVTNCYRKDQREALQSPLDHRDVSLPAFPKSSPPGQQWLSSLLVTSPCHCGSLELFCTIPAVLWVNIHVSRFFLTDKRKREGKGKGKERAQAWPWTAFPVPWGCQQELAVVIQAEGQLAIPGGVIGGASQGPEGEEKV